MVEFPFWFFAKMMDRRTAAYQNDRHYSVAYLVILLFFFVSFQLVLTEEETNEGRTNDDDDPFVVLLSPVILIPGDGGSALEARFDKPTVPKWYCAKSTSGRWERLWVPPIEQLVLRTECWTDTIRLRYDKTTDGGHSRNGDGIEIRVVPGVEGLEVQKGIASSNVYATLIDRLQDESIDFTAAPYDFRLSPVGNPDFLVKDVKSMVESAYQRTNGTKVTLITHSYGALWIHYFLTRIVDESWKHKYLNAWIPISPAYGGAVFDMLQVLTGFNSDIPNTSPEDFVDEQRSYESALWLLPAPELYGDEVLVQTGDIELEGNNDLTDTISRRRRRLGTTSCTQQNETFESKSYTARMYKELFEDAGFDTFQLQWQHIQNLTLFSDTDDDDESSTLQKKLTDPMIPTFPLYGNDVKTASRFHFPKGFGVADESSKKPTIVMTKAGDGTVTHRSLSAGDHWKHSSPLKLNGEGHGSILTNETALDHILQILRLEM